MPGRYRQTWIGGSNPHNVPMRVDVDVWFDGWLSPARSTYLVPPHGGWVRNLDDLYGASVEGVSTDARIEVRCDQWCAIERAIYFAPLSEATIAQIPVTCVGGAP